MLESFIAYTVQLHVFLESFFPPSTTFPPSNVVDVVLLVTAGMLVCILMTIRDIRIIRSYKDKNHLIKGEVIDPSITDSPKSLECDLDIITNIELNELAYLRIIVTLLEDNQPFVHKKIAASAELIMKKLGAG